MSSLNRPYFVVEINGPWRLYTNICPNGWTMLGTVQRGVEIGALGISAAGIYAQINAGAVRSLDQRKLLAAMPKTHPAL